MFGDFVNGTNACALVSAEGHKTQFPSFSSSYDIVR
jgi:hypothetical protein